MILDDSYFMRLAIKEAAYAYEENEVPVGAIVVSNNRIIGKGHNQTEKLKDVTAHAEMLALTAAANYLGSKYLDECTLYVTLEPCIMCAAALRWARIGRLVFGATDPKAGFLKIGKHILHPKTELTSGIMQHDCAVLMTEFFTGKR